METHRMSNGLPTFLEHYGLSVGCALLALVSRLFIALRSNLDWCCLAALLIAGTGVGLIFHAKRPLYRQRRFLTFGSRVLPPDRRPFYRWGYGCVVFAAAVLLGLSLANP